MGDDQGPLYPRPWRAGSTETGAVRGQSGTSFTECRPRVPVVFSRSGAGASGRLETAVWDVSGCPLSVGGIALASPVFGIATRRGDRISVERLCQVRYNIARSGRADWRGQGWRRVFRCLAGCRRWRRVSPPRFAEGAPDQISRDRATRDGGPIHALGTSESVSMGRRGVRLFSLARSHGTGRR